MAISAPVFPGRDTGIRLALFDQIDRHAHRRILLGAQRYRRRLVHGDHFTGMANNDTTNGHVADQRSSMLSAGRPGSRARRLITHELERRRNGHPGTVVPTHAVNGDGNSHRWQTKEKAGRLAHHGKPPAQSKGITRSRPLTDFLAAIVARGADVVTQMHLAGRRLDGQRRAAQESCARCMPRLDGDFLFC
jgi:hypothetical protein